MKKVITAAMILVCVSAIAEDAFLSDYNLYAKSLYGISELSPLFQSNQYSAYKSESVEISVSEHGTEIYGSNPLDVITASCCTLRVIDNASSMTDQYGKVLMAYFLHSSSGKESRSTTEAGIQIFFSESSGVFSVKLVR